MNIVRRHFLLILLYLIFAPYFAYFLPNIFTLQVDGLYAAHSHIWSDWPLHYSLLRNFSHKPPSHWFDYHPFFSGGKSTYPFLTNLFPSFAVRLGASLEGSLWVSTYIYLMLLILSLYCLSFQLLKSSRTAFLSVGLFFCSSGWGFIRYFQDSFEQGRFFAPEENYAQNLKLKMYAGNVVKGFLLPQRGFLLGMLFGATALLLLCLALERLETKRRPALVALCISALLFGLLPITHVHTLFVLFPAVALLFCLYRAQWRYLLGYSLLGGVLLYTLFEIFLANGIESQHFFKWYPGWCSEGGILAWISFWFQIFGLMIPLAIFSLALLWREQERSQAKYVLTASFVPFLVGNLVLTQPLEWDNTKLFFWCYFFFACLVADLLNRFFRSNSSGLQVLGFFLFLSLSLTGVIELCSLLFLKVLEQRVLSNEEVSLAEEIRHQTPLESVFLVAPRMNHFVMVAGERSIVLGYPNWVKNFGFEPESRLRDIIAIYEGDERAVELLQKYKIAYVVIGKKERDSFPGLREDYFHCHFPVAFEKGTTTIYQVEKIPENAACRSPITS